MTRITFLILLTTFKLWGMGSEFGDCAGFVPTTVTLHTYEFLPITLEHHVSRVRENFSNLKSVPKKMRIQVLGQLGVSHLLTIARNPIYFPTIKEYMRREIMLDLSQELHITAEFIQQLSALYPNVINLTLSRMSTTLQSTILDDSLIQAIATCFKKLKRLSLPGNNITVGGVRALVDNLLQLEELDLQNNQIALDRNFVTMLLQLPYLTTLNVQGNTNLTHEAKELLDGWKDLPGRHATY